MNFFIKFTLFSLLLWGIDYIILTNNLFSICDINCIKNIHYDDFCDYCL